MDSADLTAWADAAIHKLVAENWRRSEQDADPMGGPFDPPRRHHPAEARALLAARDRVLAGLSACARDVLTRRVEQEGWCPAHVIDGVDTLRALRLLDGQLSLTPLGHELARCIREGVSNG